MNYNDKSTFENLGMKGEKQILWRYLPVETEKLMEQNQSTL